MKFASRLAILAFLLGWATVAAARPPPPTPGPARPATPPERPAADQTAVDPSLPATRTEAPAPAPRDTAITASMLVKVVHPDEVRAKVIAKTKELGGFPVLVSDGELQLKVPPEHVATVVDLLASSGTVLDKSLQRRDRTEVIAQLEARLRSKREIFSRLRKFLDDSNVSATLKVESSMTQLVRELEQIKGELEVETASTRHALVVARFDFHREGRITYVRSPFAWLNTVDLDHFLAEFGR